MNTIETPKINDEKIRNLRSEKTTKEDASKVTEEKSKRNKALILEKSDDPLTDSEGKKLTKKQLQDKVLQLQQGKDQKGKELLQTLSQSLFELGDEVWRMKVTDSEHGFSEKQIKVNAGAWADVLDYYLDDSLGEYMLLVTAVATTGLTVQANYMGYKRDISKTKKVIKDGNKQQ